MTITKFLSCFEVLTVSKKNEGTATSTLDGHSLRVRKNLSSETLAKFGRFTLKQCDIFRMWFVAFGILRQKIALTRLSRSLGACQVFSFLNALFLKID